MTSSVSIVRAAGYERAEVRARLQECLAPLGGLAAFVAPGQRVLIKPNLLTALAPERAATTHPAGVAAVIELVQAAGATPFIADSPGIGDVAGVARATGIEAVMREHGVLFGDCAAVHAVDCAANTVARRLTLLKAVADADVIITLPKLKTHVQMTFTGAIKNQFGLVPGVAKGQYHFRLQDTLRMAELMLDINRAVRPALAIMDAIVGMEGDGPAGGAPRAIGVLLASADLMALDVVACRLIGLDPATVPTVQAGTARGFGATALADIRVIGPPIAALAVPDFRTVAHLTHPLRIMPLPTPLLKMFRSLWTPRPRIIATACVQCGACHKGCPVSPPAIDPKLPPRRQVNDRTCIRCYCCHEFCPARAIRLQRSWLDRVLQFTRCLNWLTTRAGRAVNALR